jgi:uncharacterized RDD family membrane protein YckC
MVGQVITETPVRPAYASLGKRFLAQFLDGIIAFSIFFLLGRTIAARFGGLTTTGFEMTGAPALLLIFSTAFFLFLYFLLFEGMMGATFGKVLAGIKVVNSEGGLVGMRGSLIRNLVRPVDAIGAYIVGAIAVVSSPRRQRLGDMVAGTVVVKSSYSLPARSGSLIVLIGFLFGAILFSFAGRTGEAVKEVKTTKPRFAKTFLTDNKMSNAEKTDFSPDIEKIYLVFTLADVPEDTTIKAEWIAEKVEGVEADLWINQYELKAGGKFDSGNFSLARPAEGWPQGDYRVDLYLGGILTYTGRFHIKGQ